MVWKIELSAQVDRELGKLDPQQSKRILKFLRERVASLVYPRSIGQALQGSELGEFWKYRVGDYRLICKIEDERPSYSGSSRRPPKGNLPVAWPIADRKRFRAYGSLFASCHLLLAIPSSGLASAVYCALL